MRGHQKKPEEMRVRVSMSGSTAPFKSSPPVSGISPRDRVLAAISHREPDRVPVDFLATPETWRALIKRFAPDTAPVGDSEFMEPDREALLRLFEVDCRLVSYDMFCNPPTAALRSRAVIDWWAALSRSTPNRMWRQVMPNGDSYDIWGHHIRIQQNPSGAYEEFASWPLSSASSLDDLKRFAWPEPDWWDFRPLPAILEQINHHGKYHIRFRIGSIFETSWQLRGMEEFLIDLHADPDIPLYIMDRLTDILVENLKRVLELAGDQLDMVYFYDDVATQNSLLISKGMWRNYIRPRHTRLIETAKAYGKPVMYHCDGAIYPLIPELIDMGIDVLNPIQADARGMEPPTLKKEFGSRLSFHGGIDIIQTLPRGSTDDVTSEVQERVQILGKDGGYILASSHHMQPDTPIENIIAMYEPVLRYRTGSA